MINYNCRFSFERDQYNWYLHDWRDGEDKDGNATRVKKTTYHPTLTHICKEVIDRSAGDCESLEELIGMLTDAESRLVDRIVPEERPLSANISINKKQA